MLRKRSELVELTEAHTNHKSAGGRGHVYLMTRTIPHTVFDSCKDMFDQFGEAERFFRRGSPWKRIKERHGIVGTVRSLEATVGKSGWHPHAHELIFTEYELPPPEFEEMRVSLFKRWESAVKRAGFGKVSYDAFDLRSGRSAQRYVTKFGIEHELTGSHIKQGRNKSLTPWDLLRLALSHDDPATVKASRSLYSAYVASTKGKRQLTYSRGLREFYGLRGPTKDEEAASEPFPESKYCGSLPLIFWKDICAKGWRGDVINALRRHQGDVTATVQTLRDRMAAGIERGQPRA